MDALRAGATPDEVFAATHIDPWFVDQIAEVAEGAGLLVDTRLARVSGEDLREAKRLGLDGGRLAIGTPADLVLFDPDMPFVLDRFALRSKSKNSPFDGRRLQGRVEMTIVGGRTVYSTQ